MTAASLRRYAILAGLLFFVAYFGVWQVYDVMAPEFGAIWAGAMAGLALLGLGVIGVVGVILNRTRARMESAGGGGSDG